MFILQVPLTNHGLLITTVLSCVALVAFNTHMLIIECASQLRTHIQDKLSNVHDATFNSFDHGLILQFSLFVLCFSIAAGCVLCEIYFCENTIYSGLT